uniref:Uncharacterized protein n=1 Tax=Panagrolaimus sp. ES5 TaxID=591445 RepID=A0AC34F3K8_9BILA
MSDSDEYEKIDVEDIEDKDAINDVSTQTTSSDPSAVVTEMEMSVDNPTEAENNEAVKSEETKSESNDDNDRAKFREMHEEFLKIFLCKSGIENPVIEEEKMKDYCNLLQPSFEKMDQSLSACPFGKYLQPQKHVEHLDSSKNAMAQANPPPSKPSPLMDSKIEEALSASKSAQEEYLALLEERDKAFVEDPKDTQLHEHMTQLCLDALHKSEEAAEKYANLCAAAAKSSTTASKLTIVTGPTYSIPPKSVPSSGLDKGADIIKQADHIKKLLKKKMKKLQNFYQA